MVHDFTWETTARTIITIIISTISIIIIVVIATTNIITGLTITMSSPPSP